MLLLLSSLIQVELAFVYENEMRSGEGKMQIWPLRRLACV
jgi:hypothetical protein